MTYTPSEKNRADCRKWYAEHKEEHKEAGRQYQKQIRDLINKETGTECLICGNDTTERRIILHAKNGLPHSVAYHFYKSEWKKGRLGEYARLCFRCHVMVHWVLHILNERTEKQQDKIVDLAKQGVR